MRTITVHVAGVPFKLPRELRMFGVPYEWRVVDLPGKLYGDEDEASKVIRILGQYQSVEEFLVCIAHMALEVGRFESVHGVRDHDELDRIAHCVAEAFRPLILAA